MTVARRFIAGVLRPSLSGDLRNVQTPEAGTGGRPPSHSKTAELLNGCFCTIQIRYSPVTEATEIKYKIGNERLVKVTSSAAAKLSQLLQRQGRPRGALRVAVIGGGCSGLQYKMDLVDGPANRDILVESNSVK